MDQDAPSLVVDGLFFFSDGDPTDALAGGVHAINLTVSNPLSDLTATIDELAAWCDRLRRPASPWHLVERSTDIGAARDQGKLGLIMGWQNMLPIADRPERLWLFHRLGLRVMQLTYNHANCLGDGCLERRGAGLSELGRLVVGEMNKIGLAIDLSHCSERVALDAAAITTRPVLLTHANATAIFKRPRNKSDEVIRAVARTGGVIGLSTHGFMNWSGNPAEPPTLDGFVANVRHVRDLVGIDHIGVGTDFAAIGRKGAADFFLAMSKDRFAGAAGDFVQAFGNQLESRYPRETPSPREYQRIVEALHRAELKADEIDKIVGRNFIRAFRDIWGE